VLAERPRFRPVIQVSKNGVVQLDVAVVAVWVTEGPPTRLLLVRQNAGVVRLKIDAFAVNEQTLAEARVLEDGVLYADSCAVVGSQVQ